MYRYILQCMLKLIIIQACEIYLVVCIQDIAVEIKIRY